VTDYKNLIIEPLNTSHDRPGFQCGESSLDEYIKKQAKQDVKRRVSRVFVARELDKPGIILAYYTLSTLSIELPPPLARKLPRHPIPAALIGRLAVSQQVQGYGVGRMLVADAIKRILGVSNEIAIYAVVVDALNEGARRFYQQFGFVPLKVHSRRLFLPLKSL
jgi:GNAT superfamily N-acetyltransferase